MLHYYTINKNFLKMWSSNLSSVLGQRFRELVIPIIVLTLTASPLITALVALSQQAGGLLFAIPAGTWIESKDKRNVMIYSKAISSVLLLILSFLLFQGEFTSLLIAVVLFLLGIVGLLSRTAFNSLIPKVSGRENLVNAHTSLEAADAISTLIGPIVAGFFLAQFGSAATILVCGGLMLISMLFILSVQVTGETIDNHTNKVGNKEKLKKFWQQAVEGFTILFTNTSQVVCTIVICLLSFSTTFVVLTVVIHGKTAMDLEPDRIGLLLSCAGVGNIAGVVLLRWVKKLSWIPLLSIMLIVSGMGTLLIGMGTNFYVACFGMFLFDGALSMAFVIQASIHQGITPDHMLSRVKSSTYVMGGISGILGTFLSGAIPEAVNSYIALWTGASVLIVPSVLLLFLTSHSTRVDKVEPLQM
ncbi:MFS transporter [Pontibacillus sp. HN14]|nr:MFS transporter [Pontibacillus sp. HN14]MCD5323202.1 MFS transporter [Pontibacillus sp. HN14]